MALNKDQCNEITSCENDRRKYFLKNANKLKINIFITVTKYVGKVQKTAIK